MAKVLQTDSSSTRILLLNIYLIIAKIFTKKLIDSVANGRDLWERTLFIHNQSVLLQYGCCNCNG
jgi:hypothetical protein